MSSLNFSLGTTTQTNKVTAKVNHATCRFLLLDLSHTVRKVMTDFQSRKFNSLLLNDSLNLRSEFNQPLCFTSASTTMSQPKTCNDYERA